MTLRLVPELDEHHEHAGNLTPEHDKRMITIAHKDGTRVRGVLEGSAPSLTPGLTVLWITACGRPLSMAVPHHAPVYVHSKETG